MRNLRLSEAYVKKYGARRGQTFGCFPRIFRNDITVSDEAHQQSNPKPIAELRNAFALSAFEFFPTSTLDIRYRKQASLSGWIGGY